MITHIPEIVTIPDIISEVVDKVNELSGLGAKFYHDTPEKLEERLKLVDSVQAVKYPAFLLFHDFPERLGGSYYAEVTIEKLVIATTTNNTKFADDRYNTTFKPVLYPLYEWFKIALARHKSVVLTDPNNIICDKTDRIYWGTQQAGQTLNDYLDAIELKNLRLLIKQNC